MTPAEVDAMFARYGSDTKHGDGPWLKPSNQPATPLLLTTDPKSRGGRYLSVERLLAALAVAEATLNKSPAVVMDRDLFHALADYRSTR